MTLKALRLKISKTLSQLGEGKLTALWLRMNNDELAELKDSRDAQDLAWIGLEDDSDLVVVTTNK